MKIVQGLKPLIMVSATWTQIDCNICRENFQYYDILWQVGFLLTEICRKYAAKGVFSEELKAKLPHKNYLSRKYIFSYSLRHFFLGGTLGLG